MMGLYNYISAIGGLATSHQPVAEMEYEELVGDKDDTAPFFLTRLTNYAYLIYFLYHIYN